MEPNQNEKFAQLFYAWWGTKQTFLKKYCQNTCNEIAINANSHFSHYKPMETLSCHNIKSTWAMAIKLVFVEANVMNIAANFQL